MAVMDHNKQWEFLVKADPMSCAETFRKVMTGSPGLRLRGVKWELDHGDAKTPEGGELPALLATYVSRAGIAAVNTGIFGARAEAAEARAVGSQLTFAWDPVGDRTRCIMWLSTANKTFTFTADAGYIRSYMSSVEKQLRLLDSDMTLVKH
jgi:hypothetical protein